MTSASASGPAGAEQLDADLGELPVAAGPGVSYRKTGPDMLTRQGRGGHSSASA